MSKAGWAAQRTQAQRRFARRQVRLQDVGIQPSTQRRYYLAVRKLLPFIEAASSDEELDDSVASWIEQQFEEGAPLHLISDGLSGIQHFQPYLKGRIPRSWKLFSIWRRFEVPMRAPPITEDIIFGFAGKLFSEGDFVMAALLVLGFHGMLRTHEMLTICPSDFLLGPDSRLVSLPASKSGVRNNTKESVAIYDMYALELRRIMVSERKKQGYNLTPCWSHSGTAFRTKFYGLAKFFKIQHLRLKPYSVRRGGATHDFKSHGQMERTLIRGRWSSTNIARLYITDALAQLPKLTMSHSSKKSLEHFSMVFHHRADKSGKRGTKRKVA